MAIGIATSLLVYMFLKAFNDGGGDGGYSAPSSGYGKRYGYYHMSNNFRHNVFL